MRTRDDHDHRRRSGSREEDGDDTPKTYSLKALVLTAVSVGTAAGCVGVLIGFLIGSLSERSGQPNEGVAIRQAEQPVPPADHRRVAVAPVSDKHVVKPDTEVARKMFREEPELADRAAKAPKAPEPVLDLGELSSNNALYRAYQQSENRAAADARYLNKRCRFTLTRWAIDKDSSSGLYYAWQSIFDPSAGRHFCCYFRADQMPALAALKPRIPGATQALVIEGVCAGKIGVVQTRFVDPAIAFRDCEIVTMP